MGALAAFGGGATSLEISLVMAASLPSAPQNSRQAVSSSHLAERMALDATASGFLTAEPRDRPGWCPCVRDSRSLSASAVFRPKTPARKRLGALLTGLSLCVCGYNQKRFQSIHARWGAVLFSASSLAAFAALTNQFSEKGATVRMPGTERTTTTKRDHMPWGERVRRYAVCLVGIFCISFGVALFTKSGTGTSAISVIPYTLSLVLPQLSYGTWVALFNMAMALAQPAMLRRDTDWLNIVQQLFFATVFGSIVDFSMWILTYCNPVAYWQSFILMLLSIPTLAMGAYLTLISRVGVMAGDGFTLTISQVTGKEFALIRVISDSTMTAIAVVMCLVFWGSLVTVREGTICAALFTGAVVGWYKRHLKGFEYALLPTNREQDQDAQTPSEVPSQNFVVTVSREYGSGGREVGRIIARELGVPFYDSEIINRLATEEGFADEYLERNEQRLESSAREAFYRFYAGAVPDSEMPQVERLFVAEQRIIRKLAASGSCVIVGRLANHILSAHTNRLDLFVRADLPDKVRHVMDREGLGKDAARAKIEKVDHDRAEHCRYFAHQVWGDARNYDITMNTSKYGIEQTGEMLALMAAKAWGVVTGDGSR